MEGIATNAVIAVPDDKYGEVGFGLRLPQTSAQDADTSLSLDISATTGCWRVCGQITRRGSCVARRNSRLRQEARRWTERSSLGVVPRRGRRSRRVSQDSFGQDPKGTSVKSQCDCREKGTAL